MDLPPLVNYDTATEYRAHYERVYCRGVIQTFDHIRVYFSAGKFGHTFYESSGRDGRKDVFSPVRARRIDWIKATLENPNADLYNGYIAKTHSIDDSRRVAVVYEDFVVVVRMGLGRDGRLKANFVTCYQADNSIAKIRQSPIWSRADCLAALGATEVEGRTQKGR